MASLAARSEKINRWSIRGACCAGGWRPGAGRTQRGVPEGPVLGAGRLQPGSLHAVLWSLLMAAEQEQV